MIALFFSQPVHSQEWTRFHGPNGQGVAKLKNIRIHMVRKGDTL